MATLDGPKPPLAPLLILDRVTEFLDEAGLGSGALKWHRIGDGQSNVTYRIARDTDSFVLRRGPRPPLPRSAHDMMREARILMALRPLGVPVPRVLAVCERSDVLGVPFYVMDWVDGTVITDEVPDHLRSWEEKQRTAQALVEALVALHNVDVAHAEVAELGRAEGYLARQVSRFAGLWESNASRDLRQVPMLAEWLERNCPASQRAAVVHGDYRLGNVMFAATGRARITAVLDWEMATLGDPLTDLGYLVSTYTDTATPLNPMHLSPVTGSPGYPGRADLIKMYADLTGLDMQSLDWYRVLALWKAAVFCEAIYGRWVRGERPGDPFGPMLERGVPSLLDEASRLAV